MTAVKLCGFTCEEDVRAAVRLGADYLGLNLVTASPRYVAPEQAALLAAAARDEAARMGAPAPKVVGVFAAAAAEADAVAQECGLDAVQLHGDGADGPLAAGLPVIVAVRPRPGEPLHLPQGVWAYLVDAYHDVLLGGTGRLADWEAAAAIARRERVFLAGGLTPANVADAVRAVQPFAADVASGIESTVGVKDHARMRAFIEGVRQADDDIVRSRS